MSEAQSLRSVVDTEDDASGYGCPHCGRPYDEETETTIVECGACDEPHELIGSKEELVRRTFECSRCGTQNVIPEIEEGDAS